MNSLHRDRYNTIRDERDAYQQMQGEFSGQIFTATKQISSSEQDRARMEQEITELQNIADFNLQSIQQSLIELGVL